MSDALCHGEYALARMCRSINIKYAGYYADERNTKFTIMPTLKVFKILKISMLVKDPHLCMKPSFSRTETLVYSYYCKMAMLCLSRASDEQHRMQRALTVWYFFSAAPAAVIIPCLTVCNLCPGSSRGQRPSHGGRGCAHARMMFS
jgi:hypothetical protein